MRSSKIKGGGYSTVEDEDFVVVNKDEQNGGLFQLQYDDDNNDFNDYSQQNYAD